MKVLMLGWEFPPHISGGLGTACLGLTRGLVASGVEVLFAIPRAEGDEDAAHMELFGANQVLLPERPAPPSSPSSGTAQRAGTSGTGEGATSGAKPGASAPHAWSELASFLPAELRTLLSTIEIDSPLRPYMTADSYKHLLTVLGTDAREPVRRVGAQLAAELAESVDQTLAPNTALGSAPSPGTPSPEAALPSGPRTRRYDFSGAYGQDLYAEVFRYAEVIGTVARERDFDVIHAHDWMTYPAGIAAKAATGKPLVLHLHASEYDRSGDAVNQTVRDIEQAGFAAADLVICVSHYTAKVLRTRYHCDPKKIRVVHNAVTQKEQSALLHTGKAFDDPIVLFLGRVTFQKGPDYFIDAARRVIDIEPRVKFVMSGSGDMLSSMIERAARLGLSRHIHFTGFLRGDEVERMFAMADVYVMPSVSEPFGISPLEAMALDVPVIVSNQSGVSEILQHALKVDFWDVEGLADKILAILEREPLRRSLSEEGGPEVRRMRWESRGALVRDIYSELIP